MNDLQNILVVERNFCFIVSMQDTTVLCMQYLRMKYEESETLKLDSFAKSITFDCPVWQCI